MGTGKKNGKSLVAVRLVQIHMYTLGAHIGNQEEGGRKGKREYFFNHKKVSCRKRTDKKCK